MDLTGFRDPSLAKGLIEAIRSFDVGDVSIMEVCGTHTVSIARNGLRDLLPANVRLISGPGCPVCVTANSDIDTAIALARVENVIVTTFGDMMKVPGSTSSMSREKGNGADVRIVYSPLDALKIAQDNPDKHVVFIGVGFETTVPIIGAAVKRAAAMGLENFSVFAAHKTVPGALDAIVNDPEVKIDALILPGHVSTVIGAEPYRFLAEKYGVPGVITGFEPVDILQGVAMLLRQLAEGRAEIEIAYSRGVMAEGNRVAQALSAEVFEVCDTDWRGLGTIPASGLRLRDEFAQYDALKRLSPEVEETRELKGCRCGDVLRGVILPHDCNLFGRGCTPEHPVGPCMVSSEGSCAAYYRYSDHGRSAHA